jgi:hypothetical protein
MEKHKNMSQSIAVIILFFFALVSSDLSFAQESETTIVEQTNSVNAINDPTETTSNLVAEETQSPDTPISILTDQEQLAKNKKAATLKKKKEEAEKRKKIKAQKLKEKQRLAEQKKIKELDRKKAEAEKMALEKKRKKQLKKLKREQQRRK